jgi:50S ribosomal protein L16 3-hydroxylase
MPTNLTGKQFWKNFVKAYWEKRPVAIQQPFASPVATPTEIFEGLVTACDAYRSGERSFGLSFYIEHALLITDVGERLPVKKDGSIAGYAERVKHMIGRRRFGLVLEDFHVYHSEIWFRIRDFLSGLFQAVGNPGDRTTSAVFLGDYEKTPSGLHKGDATTFKFVVDGQKRMRVWPHDSFPDEFEHSPTRYYENSLQNSLILEGGPGDLIYWPSTYWHIGESINGGLVTSLSLPLFAASAPSFKFDEVVKNRGASQQSNETKIYPIFVDTIQNAAKKMPDIVAAATRKVAAESRSAEVKQDLLVQCLNRLSGSGFAKVPPALASVKLEEEDIIHGDPRYPILLSPTANGEMICSANGHSLSVTAHPHIMKLMERLNRGKAFKVKKLMEQYAGIATINGVKLAVSAGEIRMILEKLYSLRAIRRKR